MLQWYERFQVSVGAGFKDQMNNFVRLKISCQNEVVLRSVEQWYWLTANLFDKSTFNERYRKSS